MAKLGREISRAHDLAARTVGGLAVMIQRQHGSKAMILLEAERLEKAAKILREAIGDL